MNERIKIFGKGAVQSLQAGRKKLLKAQEARSAVAVLEKQNGPLSEAVKRRAREDATERLGAARHAAWLMVYAAVQGEYRDGWLPDSYYLENVMPRINGTAHHLGRIRATNRVFFDNDAVPDLIYVLNGRLMGRDLVALTPVRALEILRDSGAAVVFKADESGFGKGVKTLDTAHLDQQNILRLGDGVIQPKIVSHPVFDMVGGDALATVRIGTVLPDTGRPQVRTCYLKLGRAGQPHVIARDQIRVAVDWKSGALNANGYLSNWQRIEKCPMFDTPFGSLNVPAIQKAVDIVLDLHSRIPLARYVCWDIAIDAGENVHLLEWEGGVVSFAEAVQGPCFTDLGWDKL
jgi:hypothetical protein